MTLADRVLSRLDLRSLARPVLVELMERTGETATLSVPGEREAITVDSVPSRSSVVCMARLGRPSVAHATAVGKVMLAFGGGPLPRERDLRQLTERTITDRARLAAEVLAVRQRGYGTVFGEREQDVNAIAAPVFDRAGGLAAILGLQGPANRLDDPTRLLGELREGAATLTRALGAEQLRPARCACSPTCPGCSRRWRCSPRRSACRALRRRSPPARTCCSRCSCSRPRSASPSPTSRACASTSRRGGPVAAAAAAARGRRLAARAAFAPLVRDGLLAVGLSSAEVASVGLVALAGADATIALGAVTGSLVLAALVGPLAIGWLSGSAVHVSSGHLLVRFALVVLVPLAGRRRRAQPVGARRAPRGRRRRARGRRVR